MLYLVGIGLSPKHITKEAVSALKSCEKIYLDGFTSQLPEGHVASLSSELGKEIIVLGRKEIEERFIEKFVLQCKGNVALAVPGNPLNATTHVQLAIEGKESNVPVKIVPGISIFDFLAFTGLDRYKFGRTATIVFHEDEYEPESFYDVIVKNKSLGLHTFCLLDIKKEENRLMNIGQAISLLELIEERREKNIISESILVGLAAMGTEKEQIFAGTSEKVKNFNFHSMPQSLIVCGNPNEKEIEALKVLGGLE